MNQPAPPVAPPVAPKVDLAARSRRNRILALILAVVAVIFYVGIGMRWSGGH